MKCNLNVRFSTWLQHFINEHFIVLSPEKHKGHIGEKNNSLDSYPSSVFDHSLGLWGEILIQGLQIHLPAGVRQASQMSEASQPLQKYTERSHGCSKWSGFSAPSTRCHAQCRPFASSILLFLNVCFCVKETCFKLLVTDSISSSTSHAGPQTLLSHSLLTCYPSSEHWPRFTSVAKRANLNKLGHSTIQAQRSCVLTGNQPSFQTWNVFTLCVAGQVHLPLQADTELELCEEVSFPDLI